MAKVDWTENICGMRAIEFRDALKRMLRHEWMSEKSISGEFGEHLSLEDLLSAGYVEEEPDPDERKWHRHRLSKKALSLINAKSIPRISRAKADRLLAGFLDRCRTVNEDSIIPFVVRKVWLYGSMLRDEIDVGDIDLSPEIERKSICNGYDDYERAVDAWEEALGWRPWYYSYQAEDHVWRILKGGCAYISLTTIHSLEALKCSKKCVFEHEKTTA